MRVVAHFLRSCKDDLELLEGGEGICEAFEGGDIPTLNHCLVYGCQLSPQDCVELLLTSGVDKDCEAIGGTGGGKEWHRYVCESVSCRLAILVPLHL